MLILSSLLYEIYDGLTYFTIFYGSYETKSLPCDDPLCNCNPGIVITIDWTTHYNDQAL